MSLGAQFPKPPNAGDAMSHVWGRLVVAALWAVRPIAGKGIRISPGPRGCVIEAVAQSGGGGGGKKDDPDPFEPVDASSGEEKKVKVTFGIVNNIVPEIDGVPLDETVGTPALPPTLATPSTGKIYLQTNWTGDEPKEMESAEVKFTADEVPADDEEHGHQLLSTVTVDEETGVLKVNVGVTHSLRVERMRCGTSDSAQTYYGWAGV